VHCRTTMHGVEGRWRPTMRAGVKRHSVSADGKPCNSNVAEREDGRLV
jgi:hypothetical protein